MSAYKDLLVWQNNQKLVFDFFHFASKNLEGKLLEVVGKQLFRALTSVGANLAEGSAHFKGKEFSRYVQISLSSAIESDYWFVTLKGLVEQQAKEMELFENRNVETIKMLRGLLKSL